MGSDRAERGRRENETRREKRERKINWGGERSKSRREDKKKEGED